MTHELTDIWPGLQGAWAGGALEVRVYWGDQLLRVTHLDSGTFAVGEGTDLPLPDHALGGGWREVVRCSAEGGALFDVAKGAWLPIRVAGARAQAGPFHFVATPMVATAAAPFTAPANDTALMAFALLAFGLLYGMLLYARFGDSTAPPSAPPDLDRLRALLASADLLEAQRLEAGKSRRPAARARPPLLLSDPEPSAPLPEQLFRHFRPGPQSDEAAPDEPLAPGVKVGKGAVETGAVVVKGGLTEAQVRRGAGAVLPLVRRCYGTALAQAPTLAGQLQARFVIDRSGAVSTVGAGLSDLSVDPLSSREEDNMTIRRLTTCVVRNFGQLSFPTPRGGVVTVIYPLLFRPLQAR